MYGQAGEPRKSALAKAAIAPWNALGKDSACTDGSGSRGTAAAGSAIPGGSGRGTDRCSDD